MFKRIVAGLAVVVCAALALHVVKAQETSTGITGSGNVITETRQVSGFTSVELRGVGEVNIVQGDVESLSVTSDDNILPLLTSEVVDGKLILSIKPDTNIRHSSKMQFDVTMMTVQSVELTGAGTITASDIKADQVDVALRGAGTITFNGEVGNLSVALSGAGNVILSGEVENLAVDLSGAGNVDAANLTISTALDVTLSGFGNVAYEGDAPITVTKTGLGNVGSVPLDGLTVPSVIIAPITIPEITIPAVEIPEIVIPAVVIPEIVIPPLNAAPAD